MGLTMSATRTGDQAGRPAGIRVARRGAVTAGMHALRISVAVLGAGAVAATPAVAAADVVAREGTSLVLRSSPGHGNRVVVSSEPEGLRFADQSVDLQPGPGCAAQPPSTMVVCEPAGIADVRLDVGDGDDGVTVESGVTVPVLLSGGPGNDRLRGGSGPDVLNGGPGADEFYAEGGNDRIEARDGVPEQVDCGEGADVAVVDAALDAAPFTADDRFGCETVESGLAGGEGAVVSTTERPAYTELLYESVAGVANDVRVTVGPSAFEIVDARGVMCVPRDHGLDRAGRSSPSAALWRRLDVDRDLLARRDPGPVAHLGACGDQALAVHDPDARRVAVAVDRDPQQRPLRRPERGEDLLRHRDRGGGLRPRL
jgi:hypothetical protein